MNTLMGNFSVKRFKSKKEVLKQNTIFIFCPENRTEELQSILEEYEFELVFNDYSIKDFSLKVICHFESTNLSKTQKDYLVKATELGAWVEPLVSYLDNRLGFTEV